MKSVCSHLLAACAAFLLSGHAAGQEQEPTGQSVEINGMRMYYEVHGEGEPLVLLHGYGANGRRGWGQFVPQLKTKYKLIVPDLRGHGRSTNPLPTFTHRQAALDVYALLDQLGIRQFRGMGISTGGMTLLHMATQQPDRVRAMVLVGAAHYFPEQAREIMRKTTLERRADDEDWWADNRKVHHYGDEQIKKGVLIFHCFKDSYDDMNFTRPLLGTITAKTLIVHGDRDEFFPIEIPVELYTSIPQSALWIIPNGGHLPHLDPKHRFAERALEFLLAAERREEPSFEVSTHVYKKVGDCDIKADVYSLPDAPTQPAVVLIHGGALIMGNRRMTGNEVFERIVRRFLDGGFKVVSIDYRLAPETKLPAIIEDLRDAFRWLRADGEKLGIDTKRLAAAGHSAGGYLTLMAGSVLEHPPQALISFYGYGDIAGEWLAKPDDFYRRTRLLFSREEALKGVGPGVTSGVAFDDPRSAARGKFYVYCRQTGRWCNEVAGLDATRQAQQLLPYCPLRNVTEKFPPTLLVHGTKDTDVPYEQSALMAEELKRQRIPHELITLEGLPHAFEWTRSDSPEVEKVYGKAVSFLQKHLSAP